MSNQDEYQVRVVIETDAKAYEKVLSGYLNSGWKSVSYDISAGEKDRYGKVVYAFCAVLVKNPITSVVKPHARPPAESSAFLLSCPECGYENRGYGRWFAAGAPAVETKCFGCDLRFCVSGKGRIIPRSEYLHLCGLIEWTCTCGNRNTAPKDKFIASRATCVCPVCSQAVTVLGDGTLSNDASRMLPGTVEGEDE